MIAVRPANATASVSVMKRSLSSSSAEVGSSRTKTFGIRQESTRQSKALPFSSRKTLAAFRQRRIVAVRECQDSLMNGRSASRLDDLFVGGIGPRIGDVLADRRLEEERSLIEQHDLSPEILKPQFTQILTVEMNLTGLRIVEADEKIRERRLTNTAGSHDRADAARRHVERQLVQDRVPVIGERHVAAFDRASARHRSAGEGSLDHLRRCVE